MTEDRLNGLAMLYEIYLSHRAQYIFIEIYLQMGRPCSTGLPSETGRRRMRF